MAVGLGLPAAAPALEVAITPVLGLLLYATFLGVPFARLAGAFRDGRFVATVLILNFVIVPPIAFGLSRFVAFDQSLVVGVLLVLLTPCVDYVIVFTGLAGGSRERLLAATPLLMLAQMALLPLYLWVMVGPEFAASVDLRPFVEAFVSLIVLPLTLAAITQALAVRTRFGRALTTVGLAAMVPLMMLTLTVVVGSQVAAVTGSLGPLLAVVPLFVAFAVIMLVLGGMAGRVARFDRPAQRAVVFSGVTRNSLVVLPLALALPPAFALTPLVVVTQTLVELVVMVVLVAAFSRRRYVLASPLGARARFRDDTDDIHAVGGTFRQRKQHESEGNTDGRPDDLSADEGQHGCRGDSGEGVAECSTDRDGGVGEAGRRGEEVGGADIGADGGRREAAAPRADQREDQEHQAGGRDDLGQQAGTVGAIGRAPRHRSQPEHQVGEHRPRDAPRDLCGEVDTRNRPGTTVQHDVGERHDGVEVGARHRLQDQDQHAQAEGCGEGVLEELQSDIARRELLRHDARSDDDRGEQGAAEELRADGADGRPHELAPPDPISRRETRSRAPGTRP